MSNDYNLDNDGSGFLFDDDSDIDSLLQQSNAGEDTDGTNTDQFFKKLENNEINSKPSLESRENIQTHQKDEEEFSMPDSFFDTSDSNRSEPSPVEEVKARYEEPIQPPTAVMNDYSHNDSDYTISDETTVVAEAPAVVPPTPIYSEQEQMVKEPQRMRIPSAQDEISHIKNIIAILDVYRKLTAEQKTVVIQFITSGNTAEASEAEFISIAMHVDPMFRKTVKALKNAKNLDTVERAFYVIDLDHETRSNLAALISVFFETNFDTSTVTNFSRGIVREVEKLDNKHMEFINATEAVVNAVENE